MGNLLNNNIINTEYQLQYLQGTPIKNGLIDTILSTTSPAARSALSEGQFGWLNEDQARLYCHIHGQYWLNNLDKLLWGIQNKYIDVHLHPDNSIHLHDVLPIN